MKEFQGHAKLNSVITSPNKVLVERIPIPEELVNYIEILHFDVSGLRVLNRQIIASDNYDTETYKKFLLQYRNANREYMEAFNELIRTCGKDYARELGYEFEVSFITDELIVWKVVS